jgi:spermidine/putrescine transport system ATP-binding protein
VTDGIGSGTPIPATGDAPAIELVGATKRYGEALALDALNLQIRAGEFFCLLGPSGCGKTTTLNLIGGFVPLTSGDLFIEGHRVNDLPPHRRKVNTVFQNYALFPHMTVADNVAFGLRMDGVAKEESKRRVGEALELVGLRGFGGRGSQQLSGGQQQRVALARALVKRPAVLLLDEPLGALDLKLRKQMQLELSRIHRQVRTTFVFVTHDQEEALSLATRIAVMDGGRVIQEGTPRDVYYRPVNRFVADFIGESNVVAGEIVAGADGPELAVAGGGRLAAPPDARPGAGSLMVRPESVRVGDPPAGSRAATLRGRVVGASFLGSHTRVTVETPAGRIVAAPPNVDGPRSAAVDEHLDEEVALWWNAVDGVVLEDR